MRETLMGWLRITVGLFIFAFGLHLTIHASIGVGPWDTVFIGIAAKTPLTYGLAATCVNLLILAADVAMHEAIGFGTILDAVLVGNFVDLITWMNLVPEIRSTPLAIAVYLGGLFIMAFGQYIYMRAGQGCGPKDSFVVGVGKRLHKLPIGAVQILSQAAVLIFGFLLRGPIGIGTLLSVTCMGISMQIVFSLLHFEPRSIKHKNVLETLQTIRNGYY